MVSKKNLKIGILTGPTACGKSHLALQWAIQNPHYEIINADSLNIYKEMNIGTAKPSLEERERVVHHLIDIRNPCESYTAADFVRDAHQTISDIHSRGKRALIVGGTGFYLKALLFGVWEAPPANPEIRLQLSKYSALELFSKLKEVDDESAKRIGQADHYRLIRALEIYTLTKKTPSELQKNLSPRADSQFELWIIDRPNLELQYKIRIRTSEMIELGLIDEVQKLMSKYPNALPLNSVGYIQTQNYLNGILPSGRKIQPGLQGLQSEIQLATQQLVKKQRTWFKNLNRLVPKSKWFYLNQDHELLKTEMLQIE